MRTPVNETTPEHIVYAGQYSGLGIIVNFSLTDTIIVGPDASSCFLDTNNNVAPDCFQVGPLNYLGVDGKFDYWALDIGGAGSVGTAEIEYQPGATSWAPSPVQSASQLIAAGLATSANQATQIGLGAGINNQPSLFAQNANPFFTDPVSGNADITGYGVDQAGDTKQSAGIGGQVGLPAGSGYANGIFVTPIGTHVVSRIAASHIPVSPGDICVGHAMIYCTNVPAGMTANLQWVFFNSAGTFISSVPSVNPALIAGTWMKITYPPLQTSLAPPNAATAVLVVGLNNGTSNVPATSTFYVVACRAYDSTISTTLPGDSAGGTPLLHGIQNVILNFATVIPANGSVNTGNPIRINSPGYGISLGFTCNSASTIPFVLVTVRWYDASGTVVIWRSDWVVPATTTGSTGIFGQGPVRGAFFQITLTNLDTVNTMTPSLTVTNQTHHITRDDWRTGFILTPAPPGHTWAPGAIPTANVLFSDNSISIPAAGNVQYLLPLYAGQAWFTFAASGASGAAVNVLIADAVPASAPNPGPLYDYSANSPLSGQAVVNQAITLPRRPCLLTIGNSGTVATTFDGSLTVMEYAS